jgi:flagellar basal-body rod protein FlgG
MRSLHIGATGMLAQQLNVDTISNNIANMSTSGFKRNRAEFRDLLYQNLSRPGATGSDVGNILPSGLQVGLGVRTAAVYRIHEQGPIQVTENPMDLAIIGDGFFQVELPSGETGYTRNGVFQVNQDGEIVNSQGMRMLPNIVIPANAVSVDINESGQVFAKLSGQTALQNLGQIQVANFANPTGLEAIGNNLLTETEASGNPTLGNPNSENFGRVQQGSIESSNVNVVEEITNLITAQRAYEMNSNVISTSDEMMSTVNQLR